MAETPAPQQTPSADRWCELVVPGSAATGAGAYIARVSPTLPPGEAAALRELTAAEPTPERLAAAVGTEGFATLRRLTVEAHYGDYAPEGHRGPTGHRIIGFATPQSDRLRKDWSFLDAAEGAGPDPEVGARDGQAEVVVVGSGAGGGLIAAELGRRGADVLLIEAGDLHTADAYTRFELRARHQLWWPARATADPRGTGPSVALLAGRCVGGTTVINTKVAMRADEADIAAFHRETGLLGETGLPFGAADLAPWYDYVEYLLGVRGRADWTPSVHTVAAGFTALGARLEPVRSYTDHNCTRCGACTLGCPSNAGKSALNTFIAPALGRRDIRLLTGRTVERLLIDTRSGRPRATGVLHRGRDGTAATVRARVVVLAAGALNTPQILLHSPDFTRLRTPSTALVGRTLGLHPARLVYGRFDEPQDCHRVYPITAHCTDHRHDAAGGFVVEGTTIQEPVSFAESLVDRDGAPLWGPPLAEAAAAYRHWAGLLVMANDENTGTVRIGPGGRAVFGKSFSPAELARIEAGRAFAVAALEAAGAREVVWSGLSTSHVQGSVRMGGDPRRSVVDAGGRSHDVRGLYVGDASLIPASLSANPSLTVMALAAKVADHIAESLGCGSGA